MVVVRTVLLLLFSFFNISQAGHCYSQSSCSSCISYTTATACRWCVGTNSCGMYYDACDGTKLETNVDSADSCPAPTITELPGEPFFTSLTSQLVDNPNQRNYGVSITDIDNDGKFEIVVAGFAYRNLVYKWNPQSQNYDQIADSVLQDSSRKAIGLAACDIDGDGYEELYVLNTDQYSGDTTTSDGLFDLNADGSYVDLFTEARNLESGNFVAGRSAACVDRFGNGEYGVMVANYGAEMKLFEVNENNVLFDAAPEANMALSAGGRALVTGPIISDRVDVFANNEVDYSGSGRRRLGHRDNFMFVNNGDSSPGTYTNRASQVGIADENNTGRGTALLDANGDGLIDIVYGNWNSAHRLYVQSRSGDSVTFTDTATDDMKVATPIRTVIVADFDNDGYEEIFWNNIPGENKLFRKLPTDSDWVRVNIGDAVEIDGYGTGGAVGDFDEDGMLELLVAHGESGPLQQLSLYRASSGRNNHYLRILPKTVQGAPARGARVDMTAGGRTQVRIIDSGSGYLCQMEPVAHFGLGQLLVADSVRVTWTDGSTCDFVPTGIDRMITVQKGSGMCGDSSDNLFTSASPSEPVKSTPSTSSTSSTSKAPNADDESAEGAGDDVESEDSSNETPTESASTSPEPTSEVRFTMKLGLSSEKFEENKDAIKSGIASQIGVPESMLEVSIRTGRRTLRRSLNEVDIEVVVLSSDSETITGTIESNSFASNLANTLSEATGESIQVSDVSEPIVEELITTTYLAGMETNEDSSSLELSVGVFLLTILALIA